MKDFRYKATFSNCVVKACLTAEASNFISKASLRDLKNLNIPNSLDLVNNPDLVFAVYNGAVINRTNRNDDGIDRDTAIAIKKNFQHKPTNIEHEKSKIVGHIVQAGWSSFGENKLLSDEDVSLMNDPFNLVIGSVVYRLNNEKFCNLLIDSADETSPSFNTVHSSWEIAFDDYKILLGSKNVNEAELVTDEKDIKEYSKFLRCFGGKGKTPDGKYVGRMIVGNEDSVLPIGFAFTSNPAAEVEGVIVMDYTDLATEENKDSKAATKDSLNSIYLNILKKAIK